MSCTRCRNCQTFLALFTEPTFNWGERKNVTIGVASKKNTTSLAVLTLSVQVKSSVCSESCSQSCSGLINFTVTQRGRRVKTCEIEILGGKERGGIHAVTGPHLGCGFD